MTDAINCNTVQSVDNEPKELVLKLNWTLRDRLIANLNMQSKFLNSKLVHIKQKDALLADNQDIVLALCSLPCIENKTTICDPSDPILELEWSLKNRIVTNISKHHLLLSNDVISNQTKIDLIRENNFLVLSLMGLNVYKSELICGDCVLKSWLDELGIDFKTSDEMSKTDSAFEPNADFTSFDQAHGSTKRSGNPLLNTFHSSVRSCFFG